MGRRPRGQRGPYGLDDDDAGGITVAGAAARRQLSKLEADPRLRAAAVVAYTFHLDPAAVLAEPDPLKRDVRIAAHNAVQDEERKAHNRARSSSS